MYVLRRRTLGRWLGYCVGLIVLLAAPAQGAQPDDELVQMVLGLLEDPDKDLRALGLEQVRTAAPGPTATGRFAAQLTKLTGDAQSGLLAALADRGDAAAIPAVRSALATSRDEAVRAAALRALGALGDVAELPILIERLSSGAGDEQKAARASLVQLRGDDAPAAIADRLANSPPALRDALLGVLVERRAHRAVEKILPLAVSGDAAARGAAMQALGQLAQGDDLPGMLRGVLKSSTGAEREAAEKAVMFACQRIADEGQRSEQLLAAYRAQAERDRLALLPTLGRVGGAALLPVVEQSLAQPAQREAGLRALCNWPDASVAPRLLELYAAEKDKSRQSTLLAALVRVAPLPDGRGDDERLALLKSVFALCARPDDQALVVKRARAVRTIDTLRFVMPLVDQATLAEAACETVVELAHHRNLREPNKAEFDAALDRVIVTSSDATNIERAQRYKRGQTWARPK